MYIVLALLSLSSAQFCGMPCMGWGMPMGYMGGGGGMMGAGYENTNMANAYGAGGDMMGYGQQANAYNTNACLADVNAMGAYGNNNYAVRNANQVMYNNINDVCASGTNGYGAANLNAAAMNNNMFGAGNFGGATNAYGGAAGMNNINAGGYGATGGAGGGMWGF
ncbi:uncharacterized protein MONOS_17828 [Monocercomonoides exilis]|uniref:uncharacterized protein n=1 Tax=Monocercomonoides exilis TaxID=2049356 RepID=UPI003559B203|nr:hypothetical protein MONOS_17828 [Monocercomonoides exilis]